MEEGSQPCQPHAEWVSAHHPQGLGKKRATPWGWGNPVRGKGNPSERSSFGGLGLCRVEWLCAPSDSPSPRRAGLSPGEGRTHLGSVYHAFVCRRKKRDQLLQGPGDHCPLQRITHSTAHGWPLREAGVSSLPGTRGTSPLAPHQRSCSPSSSPVWGRMRISSSARPCSLENCVNLSRRSGLGSLVRPAAESRVRGSSPQSPQWHRQPNKGQVPQEGDPNSAIPCVTPAWKVLLPLSCKRAPPPRTSQGVSGRVVGGQPGGPRRTVEQHHGGGATALGDLGGHQGVLVVVGLDHADVVLAAPAWGTERAQLSPWHRASPKVLPQGQNQGQATAGLGWELRAHQELAPRRLGWELGTHVGCCS